MRAELSENLKSRVCAPDLKHTASGIPLWVAYFALMVRPFTPSVKTGFMNFVLHEFVPAT